MNQKVENKTDPAVENEAPSGRFAGRGRWLALAAVVIVGAVLVYLWIGTARPSASDAQVDGHITQVSARVGGPVTKVNVKENQYVEAGTVLVETRSARLSGRRRSRARGAGGRGGHASRRGHRYSVDAGIHGTERPHGQAWRKPRLESRSPTAGRRGARAAGRAQARQREKEANAAKAAKRCRTIERPAAKEEIAQQQYDAAVSSAESVRAAADAARSDVSAAEVAISVAEQRARQARGSAAQAQAALEASQTGPEQVRVTKARADIANARVQQMAAALAQAELNLQRTENRGPDRWHRSAERRSKSVKSSNPDSRCSRSSRSTMYG